MIPRIKPTIQNWESEFESKFNDEIGGIKTYSTISGREAIYISLLAIGVEGKEVLVGDTCDSVISAIRRAGATPSKELGTATAAVIVTHLFGIPSNIEKNGLPIIEDCAQCIGAELNGKKVGSIGDMSIFSFGYDKPISTDGGGMLVVNNPKYLQRIDWSSFQRLGQLKSLVGIKMLEEYYKASRSRNESAEYIDKNLKASYKRLKTHKNSSQNYLRFPVINGTNVPTDKITKVLEEKGYNIRGWGRVKDLLCIPVYPGLNPAPIVKILNEIHIHC